MADLSREVAGRRAFAAKFAGPCLLLSACTSLAGADQVGLEGPGSAVSSPSPQASGAGGSGSSSIEPPRGSGAVSSAGAPPEVPLAAGADVPLDLGNGPVEAPAAASEDAPDAAAPPPGLADACAVGQQRFADSCYRASTAALPWADAQADCLATGADLVKIDSAEEDVFVGDLLDVSVWIGASDPDEDVFTWTDGSALNFENWGPGQPNRGPDQSDDGGPDCVEKRQQPDNERWFDLPCTDRDFYVCESSLR